MANIHQELKDAFISPFHEGIQLKLTRGQKKIDN